ncbi:MAG TPA: hypothetical protein VJT31_05085 [Rugosimonospora sp.]|nr:hypothetical protein [Rugosimonospora sp.]
MAKKTAQPQPNDLTVEQMAAALKAAHDAAQNIEVKGPGVIKQSRTTVYRLRRQLVPHTVIGLLWAGASAARVAPDVAGFFGGHLDNSTAAVTVAGIYVVLAVVLWWAWSRKREDRTNRRMRRRYTTLVMLCGGTWLLWAATAGPGSWRAAALWVGGYLLAAPRWYRHRLRIPAEAPPTLIGELLPPARQTKTQRLWAENIGGRGRVLDGSFLVDPEPIPFGEAYTGQLVRGRQAFGSVLAQIALIASGLDCDLDEVVVTRHPEGGQARFRITVIDRARNPLHQVVPYRGGNYDPATGLARIGTYADGDTTRWQTHEPGSGVYGGTIIGGIGSGKSRLLEGLGATHRHALDPESGRGLYVVWVIDPQGGASLPALCEHADWAATEPPEILSMLEAADRVLGWRSKVQAHHGLSHFDPTPDFPGLIIIIDECHEVFIPGSIELALAEGLARRGRKNGIGLIVASQYPGLPTFGNNEALRSSLMKKNTIVMKTASKTSRGIIPGLELDPYELPELPGFGYTVSRGGKTAPFRADLVEDPTYWAASAPQTALDMISGTGAGEDYRTRYARRQAAREALAAEIRAAQAGGVVISLTEPKTTAGARRPAGGSVTVLAPRMPKDTDTTSVDRVLVAIGAGARGTGEIAAQAGYSDTWVRTILKSLVNTGKVTRVGHGEWELTPGGARYVAQLEGQHTAGDTGSQLLAAIELVVTTQTGSTAGLADQLHIPAATATQLMDTLQRLRIVGPAGPGGERDVLIPADDLLRALEHAAAAHVA